MPYAGMEKLPEKLGADGTTIMVGDPEASLTVHLYEDPRCPYCRQFETTGGAPELQDATVQRKAKTECTVASFLDGRLGGSGSKRAVNALRAALAAGKFTEYHAVLYANQPDESVDGFTDTHLLKLAGKVEGLRSSQYLCRR
ncbi:thioredoxin domain-containing protein [Streptomyces sp. HUAS TT20]|uniref:thioredoxin domain-containing protein n=1 Tax=Streptomyces sp. HUAS TT20 TaxID=3447509 RepID=UPI002955CB42|nr:thioredoxin domain-containing protein [Streptomyces sp. HUAS 15-9]